MEDNLKAKTTAAFGWAVGGQFSNQGIGFVISIVLARILTPEDFGLASLVLVVNLVGQVFLDAGLTAGLIRQKRITETELSTFFYLNIILGILIMLIIIVSSNLISSLFKNGDLSGLLKLSSIQFFISSFGLMPSVLMKRELNFRFLSQLDVVVNVISGIVTIILAFIGFGVYSLIFRSIVSGFINVGLLWYKTTWRPSFVFSFASIKTTFNYSSGILGLGIINTVSNNFSTILIGKFLSVSTIGIYNRADSTRGLVLKSFGPLFNKVFFPVLSKIQDDEKRLQSYYLKAIQVVSLLTVFFMAFMFLFSDTLIYYLYGKQWMTAAPILKTLCIAGFVMPISNINLNLFMVKGKSRFLMIYELFKHILAAIIMTVCIAFGMQFFLYSLVGLAYLFFIMNIYLTYKKFNFSMKAQLLAFASKFIPGIILVIILDVFFVPAQVSVKSLLIVAPIFTILYFLSSFLIDKELYNVIKSIALPKINNAMKLFKRVFGIIK